MKAWVFQNVGEGLTGNWHSGGGLLVVAASGEDAAEMLGEALYDVHAAADTGLNFDTAEAVYDLPDGTEPKVWVFPDAGCC